MATSRKSRKAKLSDFLTIVKKSNAAILAGLLVLASSAFLALQGLVHYTQSYLGNHVYWQNVEQKKLDKIGASVTLDYLKNIVGAPILQDGGEKYTESIFERKGYWLQTVTDKFNNVQLYSVTVCDHNFKPKITLPTQKTIQLNVSTMAEATSINPYTFKPHYFIGATAGEGAYLIDEEYLANPGNYQTIYAGTTDACGNSNLRSYDDIVTKNSLRPVKDLYDPGKDMNINSSAIKKMRNDIRINTIAVTAPNVNIKDLRPNFIIGVDYHVIRVLPGYQYYKFQTKH